MSGMYFAAKASGINAAALAIMDAGSIPLRAVPVAVALALIPDASGSKGSKGVMAVDPTHEEEGAAISRFGFGWAFGKGISTDVREGEDGGMEVDGESNVDMELIWAESEGTFSRSQVCHLNPLKRKY